MKKIKNLLTVLALAAALTLPALGAEASHAPDGAAQPPVGSAPDAAALLEMWGGWEGYPDYVCGVWSNDGTMDNLTVAVTANEAGRAGREEILALVENDDSITFVERPYSYAALYKVQLALTETMAGDSGIYSVGIMEMDNCVSVGLDTSAPGAEAFMAETAAQFGDMVRFEGGEGFVVLDTVGTAATVPTTGAVTETGAASRQYVLLICLALAVLGGGAFLVLRRAPAARTADGQVISAGCPTRREVEQAVREAGITPDRDTLREIVRELDQE